MKSYRLLASAISLGASLTARGCNDILSPKRGAGGRLAPSDADELVAANHETGEVAVVRDDGTVVRRFEGVAVNPQVFGWTSDGAKVLLTGEHRGFYALLMDVITGQTVVLV